MLAVNKELASTKHSQQSLERPERFLSRLNMCFCRKLRVVNAPHDALLVNNIGNPPRNQPERRRNPIQFLELTIGVRDDGERESIFTLERRRILLCGNGDNLRIELRKVLGGVAERAALRGAAGPGAVREVEHDVARVSEGGECHRFPIAVPLGEVRRRLPICDSHCWCGGDAGARNAARGGTERGAGGRECCTESSNRECGGGRGEGRMHCKQMVFGLAQRNFQEGVQSTLYPSYYRYCTIRYGEVV